MSAWNDHYDEDDPHAPQAIDLIDDDDDEDTIECANCGHVFLDIVTKCPRCGYWAQGGDSAEARAMGWKWPVMVAILIAVILVYWVGL